VRLGAYEFDLKAGELNCGERRVVLQRQSHKILAMLVKYPGQFVTREEIQQELWPHGVVVNFEVGINQAISKLRHALNDSAANPQFIETVGRRGYRLKVPVEWLPAKSSEAMEFADATLDPSPLQLLASELAALCGREERRILIATLFELLQILACADGLGDEPLVAASPAAASLSRSPNG